MRRERTLVRAAGDIEDEAELAREVVRVEMREADEELVPVDALNRALEAVLACGELGLCAGGVRGASRLRSARMGRSRDGLVL